MQPNPGVGERTAEASDILPSRSRRSGAGDAPRLVVRPKVQWLLAGPVLLVLALGLVATGRPRALPIAVVFALAGLVFLHSLFDRVDLGPTTVVRRSMLSRITIQLDDIDTLRLRRIAFPWLRWVKRGFKFGRYWSLPLTLRLMHEEDARLELRCGWWNSWRELTRALLALNPELDLDQRTRGRIERYVGSAPASLQR